MALAESLDGDIICSYCTPYDVIKAIRWVDYYSPDGDLLQPSDSSLPDWDELCFRITVAEKYLDRFTGQSWRENREENEVYDINSYWHDENARRSEYWLQGGYYVQLNKNIAPFDPSKGDRIEIRTLSNAWIDISSYMNEFEDRPIKELEEPLEKGTGKYQEHKCPVGRFWFDYNSGRLYLRLGFFRPKQNGLRITYRYGARKVPPDIRRATALKVGLTLLNEELYMTKIGQGGDLGSNKNDLKKAMQDEINETILANRTFTGLYSTLD